MRQMLEQVHKGKLEYVESVSDFCARRRYTRKTRVFGCWGVRKMVVVLAMRVNLWLRLLGVW